MVGELCTVKSSGAVVLLKTSLVCQRTILCPTRGTILVDAVDVMLCRRSLARGLPEHLDNRSPFVTSQLRVPNIKKKHRTGFVRPVPCGMDERIVEYDRFATLPASFLVRYYHPTRFERRATRHFERQVHS